MCAALLLGSGPTTAFADSYGSALDSGDKSFNQKAKNNQKWLEQERKRDARKAAESKKRIRDSVNAKMRAPENQVCFGITSDESRNACLNEPYSLKSDDARNILLGQCFSLSRSAQERQFVAVCTEGKRACVQLKSDDAKYWCTQCNGSRRWLATYATGVTIQCYK